MTTASVPESETKSGERPSSRPFTRRRFLLGGIAAAGAAALGTLLYSQNQDRIRQERIDREIERSGYNAYVKAFFAGETTQLVPGDTNTLIRTYNTQLAELRSIDYSTAADDETVVKRHAGVEAAEIAKDYPTWGNPPHIHIPDYGSLHYYVIGPESSDLIGFPEDGGTLPSELQLTCDAGEAFAGDVSVSVGNTEMRVTNNGLAEQGVHIFLRSS